MKRVFLVDVLECENCGGQMKIIAAIDRPQVTAREIVFLAWLADLLLTADPVTSPSARRHDKSEGPPFINACDFCSICHFGAWRHAIAVVGADYRRASAQAETW